MSKVSAKTLPRSEIALHWIVGLGMIGLIAVGLYMTRAEGARALYPIHKSAGVLLFVVILWRAFVRLRAGWPENISQGAAWGHGLARVIHWVLILGTLAMPISGMMDSYFGGRGIVVFGLEILSPNLGDNGRATATNKSLGDLGETVHVMLGKVLIAAILLHIAGALKHHIIDKDSTLRRMLGHG